MLHFWKSSSRAAARLGILPAAFNPPTIAHLELGRAAARQHSLDEVVFLLPRVFPHKDFAGASFNQRLEMLRAAVADEPQFSIASSEAGLFIEIARAARPHYPDAELYFLCGRDAAERILHWDYGSEARFAEQLREFQLLVAPRGGAWSPPPELASRIHVLEWPAGLDAVSSAAAREAVAAGAAWEHLVPAPVAAIIRRDVLYSLGGEHT